MRHYMVALRDIVANVYLPPMFATNLGSAIRSFGDACQNKPDGNQVAQHPDDYELYHVGYWNDADSTFICEGDIYDDEDSKEKVFEKRQIAIGRNYTSR